MGFGSLWHWIIVLLIVLVLFGRGRISEMMGDFGRGISSFKKGLSETEETAARQIVVYNKIDRTGIAPGVEVDEYGRVDTIRLSALTGAGLEHLRAVLDQLVDPAGEAEREGRLEAA